MVPGGDDGLHLPPKPGVFYGLVFKGGGTGAMPLEEFATPTGDGEGGCPSPHRGGRKGWKGEGPALQTAFERLSRLFLKASLA